MERRAFIAASTASAAAFAVPHEAAAGDAGSGQGGAPRTTLIELRRYALHTGTMATRFGAYVKDALVPALGRAGHAPVGVFNVMMGAASPSLYLLLPHDGALSVVTLDDRLQADAAYRKAAGDVLALPSGDPPYLRCDSSLHTTVPTWPAIEKPAGPAAVPGRLFELRTYRSHSEAGSRKKIDMFEAQGELMLFKRLGMQTVFFSRDLVGEGLPSLTYMLVFPDMAGREKAWATFGADPEWARLRALPGYADAEVVSGITATLLRPTDASQL
ncbi:MAG TPA: NIPSNAP family protein [Vicinamibacteria bacterium]|nr:NIPSNAP family protein [Vicinamibacteria bacterium]